MNHPGPPFNDRLSFLPLMLAPNPSSGGSRPPLGPGKALRVARATAVPDRRSGVCVE